MGAISWGKRLLGKVDRVRGKYHVATFFWHFCYLPLIPLGTYLVLHEKASGLRTEFRGIRIPFSAKSYLVAWSRTILTVPFVIMLIALPVMRANVANLNMNAWWGAVKFEAIVTALLFAPYVIPGIGLATWGRASELANVVESTSVRGPAAPMRGAGAMREPD